MKVKNAKDGRLIEENDCEGGARKKRMREPAFKKGYSRDSQGKEGKD